MITEEKEEKKINQKEVLALKLFDKLNPEMITKLSVKDIDHISVLRSITKAENIYRRLRGYEDNIFSDVLQNNLVFRTSIDGWRSEQAVKIISSVIEEENKAIDDGLNARLKRVIGK